jgi:hypothetical protein
MPSHDGRERLAPGLILAVEAVEIRTIEVQHARHSSIAKQRNDKFRP